MMFENELKAAISLAREAGRSIVEHYALDLIAEEKIAADMSCEPVTEADRAASRIIVTGLQAAFPDDGILSEEEIDLPDTRLARKRVWIIDPIDGTWGFIKKDGDFAVQIGLAIDGEPVLGVVFIPLSDVMYYASQNNGAFCERAGHEAVCLSVPTTSAFSEMVIATSRNHPNPRMTQVRKHLGITKEIQRGSVGIKVGLIAERETDLYINLSPRSKFWDTCGPQAILEEAGGYLTDIFGQRIRYDITDVQNHNGIVAASAAAHGAVIRGLRPLLEEYGRTRLSAAAAKI